MCFTKLRVIYGDVCCLDAYRIKLVTEKRENNIPLEILTPYDKLEQYFQNIPSQCKTCDSCFGNILETLRYTPTERKHIEKATKGQHLNDNWHHMRKGLITASKVKTVCASRNYTQTASKLINGDTLDEDRLPQSILYGRKYEKPALDSFSKSHRFHHRKSTCSETGLYIHPELPFIGASPDGILLCKDCPKAVIEIKCLWKYKNFHPGPALVNAGICKNRLKTGNYIWCSLILIIIRYKLKWQQQAVQHASLSHILIKVLNI